MWEAYCHSQITHNLFSSVALRIAFICIKWRVCIFTGRDGFDPAAAKFKPEELQPQPIIKKSKKVSEREIDFSPLQ